MTPQIIINIVVVAAFLFFLIGLQVIKKVHRSDPDFLKRQQEKEAAYRRKQMEDLELDEQVERQEMPEDEEESPDVSSENAQIYNGEEY